MKFESMEAVVCDVVANADTPSLDVHFQCNSATKRHALPNAVIVGDLVPRLKQQTVRISRSASLAIMAAMVLLSRLRRFFECSAKRDIDIIGALAFMIILSPVFLVLAVLVSLDGGPVIYAHRRVGRDGRSFSCLKFRTMVTDADIRLKSYLHDHPEAAHEWARKQKLTHDPRVTPFGSFLRRTSLDELPQFWNVLVGEMSLVGPRPVTLVEMQERYQQHAAQVMSVRPGLTGMWQVSGRNDDIAYAERVMLDVRYVQAQTLLCDLGILLLTPACMLARKGR